MGDYSKIPIPDLKKIHYVQLKIIKLREQNKQYDGITIKIKEGLAGIPETINKLQETLKDIFSNAVKDEDSELLLGMEYYVSVLKALPLDRVKTLEMGVSRELKKRKERERVELDAGNLDKIIKGPKA